MDRVRAADAISKPEFHTRLRKWLEETDDDIIGPTGTDGRAAWVYVQDGASRYKLHEDTNRPAVTEYLQLVDQYGDDIEWHVVENQRGNLNAVAFGPDAKRLENKLYLYFAGPRHLKSVLGQRRAGFARELAAAAEELDLSEPDFFDPKNVADARQRILASIVRRRGRPAFRKQLLKAYDHRCAVTGCNVEAALEAAHIIPYKGPSTDHPGNGLLLRADLHTLFDLKLIAVDAKSMKIIVAPTLSDSPYEEFNGRPLNLPAKRSDRPHPEALEEHRQAAGLTIR